MKNKYKFVSAIFSLFLTLSMLILPKKIAAAGQSPINGSCRTAGDCQSGICVAGKCKSQSPDEIFGEIEAPQGVSQLNEQDDSGIGLILFISNIIKVASIVAGIWTMFNFIIAGFTYVTAANDSGKITKIGESLTNSVIGLVIIIASYTIAAVIGLLLFGDATYIISPQIPTVI